MDNMKIIALSGPEGSGKTISINLVFDSLLSRKETYKLIDDKHFYNSKDERIIPSKKGSKDFIAIFEDYETCKKIGVCSYGDDYKTIRLALEKLKKEGCDIVVTACRTKGNSRNVVTEFDLSPIILRKTISHHLNSTYQDCCNKMDAEEIVNQLIKNIKK